jgi:hypothetical protein
MGLAGACAVLGAGVALAQRPSQALQQWRTDLEAHLTKGGDAQSLLSMSLLTEHEKEGTSAGYLDQAFERASSRPAVMWYASVGALCMPMRPEGCPRRLDAAQRLTRIDAGNAMAWLTLAWALDTQPAVRGIPDAVGIATALDRAAHASSFHDYGYDVFKGYVVALHGVPLPATQRGVFDGMSDDQAFLTLAMLPAYRGQEVLSHVEAQCALPGSVPPFTSAACSDVMKLFGRGDSWRTLTGDHAKQTVAKRAIVGLFRGGMATPEAAKKAWVALRASNTEMELAEHLSQ